MEEHLWFGKFSVNVQIVLVLIYGDVLSMKLKKTKVGWFVDEKKETGKESTQCQALF